MGRKKWMLFIGLLAAILVATILFGFSFYQLVVGYGIQNEEENLLSRAITASAMIDAFKVQTLTGSPKDEKSHNFAQIRAKLIELKKINPDLRFIYVMAMRGKNVIFLVDAEPVTSEDYSAPGDVYDDATPELLSIFRDKKPFIEGPLTDAWGRWVSAIAPIADPYTQRVVGVIGLDIDAKRWDRTISIYRAFGISIPGFLVLVVFVFCVALFKVNITNAQLKHEIAERKQAETELREKENQLVQAKKMEAIGTLAGGVAHDLNNILSGISSYPELLLLELEQDSPMRKPLQTIQQAGEKAGVIVQDLLTLARRGLSISEVINLNPIITDFMNSPEYEKLKPDHSEIDVQLKLEENLFNIIGSPVHLSKTIMNLVSNAFEAISGKGMVAISTENRYVERPIIGYEHIDPGEYVILTVSDTGQGISSDDIEKIFVPFYTKKRMGRSGTGLGMAVVWGTVKDHNGYVDVRSVKEKGTIFTLYFPLTRRELSKSDSSSSYDKYMGNGETVLIVDDEAVQREIATGILRKLGYSPAAVSSGEEAVDYLKRQPASLVILDMIMAPGMDGLETYRRILKLNPKQRAIIASGFSETSRVREILKLGAARYVKKPYRLVEIGSAIKDALSP